MGRRRSRARPGRKKGNKCAGCGKTLHTYTESFCIRCEAKKAARAELFDNSSPKLEEKPKKREHCPWCKKEWISSSNDGLCRHCFRFPIKVEETEEEKKMHIPSMGK